MAGIGGPPGIGFGEVCEAKLNFQRMVRGVSRLKEIFQNVAGDQLNVEKFVKDLSDVSVEMFRAPDSMFEQGHLRFINMFAATRGGGSGGGGHRFVKSIMKHKDIQHLSSER